MGDLRSYLNSLRHRNVAVIGAGVSNTPLINILLSAGIRTTVCDKRSSAEIGEDAVRFENCGAKLKLGDEYLNDLTEDIIFRTPGLMPDNPFLQAAVAQGAVLTSEMEVFFKLCPCKTIAITGSDGKTTTTSIIAELLKNEGKTVHKGGNIGTPLLSKADDIKAEDIAVIELSSFQLITMQKSPNTAVVTNLSPNHLDIHNGMDEYINAKCNIFLHQKQSDRAVFNLDNETTRKFAENAPAEDILFFSRLNKPENGIFLEDGKIFESVNGRTTEIMQALDIILPGVHNIENFMAAFAAVSGIVSHNTMRKTAKSFQGVEHRLEFVRELRGVRYYNDSIASGPSRTIAGIKAFTEPEYSRQGSAKSSNLILIAGGKDKGISFDELGEVIAERVKTLVLTGKTADLIRAAVEAAPGYRCPGENSTGTPEILQCNDFTEAVHLASQVAESGDIVLLSPACTSFDRFKNFEERGNVFKDIICNMK